MKKNVGFVLFSLTCVFCLWALDKNAAVQIRFLRASFDLPAFVLLALFLAFSILLLLCVDLIFWYVKKQRRVCFQKNFEQGSGQNIKRRDAEEAMFALIKTMTSTTEGDLKNARKNLAHLHAKIGNHVIVDLLELKILKGEKNFSKLEKLSQKLLKSEDSALVGLKALTESFANQNDFSKALSSANKAFKVRQDLYWVIKYAFELRAKSKDWQGALEVLHAGLKKKLLSKEQYAEFKSVCLYELALNEKRKGENLLFAKHLTEAHNLSPDFVPAALDLSEYCAQNNQKRRASKILKEIWRINPTSSVAENYLKLFDDDTPLTRVQRMENFALYQAKNPALNNFILADLDMKAKLWDKAKAEFELFLIQNPATKKIARLIAKYERCANHNLKASQNWEKREKECVDDCVWVCTSCGQSSPSWKPFCNKCTEFNPFKWHLYHRKK